MSGAVRPQGLTGILDDFSTSTAGFTVQVNQLFGQKFRGANAASGKKLHTVRPELIQR